MIRQMQIQKRSGLGKTQYGVTLYFQLRLCNADVFCINFSILFFDSLKMHRKRHIAKRMREWLNFEWNRIEHKPKRLQNPFTANTMKLVTPKGKLFRCIRLLFYGTSYSSALKLSIDYYQFHIRTMGLIAEYLSADTHTVCTSCAIKPFPLRGCVITFRS